MSKTAKIIISIIPLISLCVLIFCLSQQPGSESDNTSSSVVSFLPESIIEFLAQKFNTDTITMSETVEAYLRKFAHFCEFGLLAVLASAHFSTWCSKRYLLYGFIFSASYAASDEFHQIFVNGRSAEVRDVLIDSCGALTSVLILFVLILLFRRIKIKKNKKNC